MNIVVGMKFELYSSDLNDIPKRELLLKRIMAPCLCKVCDTQLKTVGLIRVGLHNYEIRFWCEGCGGGVAKSRLWRDQGDREEGLATFGAPAWWHTVASAVQAPAQVG